MEQEAICIEECYDNVATCIIGSSWKKVNNKLLLNFFLQVMLYEYSETYKVAMGTKTAIENVKISTKTVEIVGQNIIFNY